MANEGESQYPDRAAVDLPAYLELLVTVAQNDGAARIAANVAAALALILVRKRTAGAPLTPEEQAFASIEALLVEKGAGVTRKELMAVVASVGRAE